MCWCRPEIRTPNCGRPECHPPVNNTLQGAQIGHYNYSPYNNFCPCCGQRVNQNQGAFQQPGYIGIQAGDQDPQGFAGYNRQEKP
jgi:hypothetical protein